MKNTPDGCKGLKQLSSPETACGLNESKNRRRGYGREPMSTVMEGEEIEMMERRGRLAEGERGEEEKREKGMLSGGENNKRSKKRKNKQKEKKKVFKENEKLMINTDLYYENGLEEIGTNGTNKEMSFDELRAKSWESKKRGSSSTDDGKEGGGEEDLAGSLCQR
jgi:hypothetical protein